MDSAEYIATIRKQYNADIMDFCENKPPELFSGFNACLSCKMKATCRLLYKNVAHYQLGEPVIYKPPRDNPNPRKKGKEAPIHNLLHNHETMSFDGNCPQCKANTNKGKGGAIMGKRRLSQSPPFYCLFCGARIEVKGRGLRKWCPKCKDWRSGENKGKEL